MSMVILELSSHHWRSHSTPGSWNTLWPRRGPPVIRYIIQFLSWETINPDFAWLTTSMVVMHVIYRLSVTHMNIPIFINFTYLIEEFACLRFSLCGCWLFIGSKGLKLESVQKLVDLRTCPCLFVAIYYFLQFFNHADRDGVNRGHLLWDNIPELMERGHYFYCHWLDFCFARAVTYNLKSKFLFTKLGQCLFQ